MLSLAGLPLGKLATACIVELPVWWRPLLVSQSNEYLMRQVQNANFGRLECEFRHLNFRGETLQNGRSIVEKVCIWKTSAGAPPDRILRNASVTQPDKTSLSRIQTMPQFPPDVHLTGGRNAGRVHVVNAFKFYELIIPVVVALRGEGLSLRELRENSIREAFGRGTNIGAGMQLECDGLWHGPEGPTI